MRQILLGLAVAFSFVGGALAQLPDYRGKHVDDINHMLTADQDATLEQRVMAIENSMDDRPQVFVVLMDTVPQGDMASFKTDLFKHWGIGQKGKDNGILFILSKLDRQIGYEVGYGLEHRITDADTAEFTAHDIKPNLKRGEENWYQAVSGVVDDIGKRLTATAEVQVVAVEPESDFNWMAWVAIGLSGMTILWFIIKRRRASRTDGFTIPDHPIFRSQTPPPPPPSPRPSYAPPPAFVPHPTRMPPPSMNPAPRPPASPRSTGAGVVTGAVIGAAAGAASRRKDESSKRSSSSSSDTSSSPSSSSSSSWSSPSDSSSSPPAAPSSDPGGGSSGGGGSTDSF